MIFKYGIKIGAVKNNPSVDAYILQDVTTVEELENSDELPNYLEKEELIHFLDTAQKHGLDTDLETFRTLAYTGIRVGELCALKKTDINFEEHKIRIIRTLYNPNNNYRLYKLNTPKTISSIREIDVEPEVIQDFINLLTIQEIEKKNRPLTYHDE
ncbi:tyrosine-type recombinase/integrase [Paenibacillus jamilae]|uniref:tyrosine-type recombinase/integrase n=1 Tax=Paenibacillus jamilae TaxID=114136 RepID=UPI003D2C8A32